MLEARSPNFSCRGLDQESSVNGGIVRSLRGSSHRERQTGGDCWRYDSARFCWLFATTARSVVIGPSDEASGRRSRHNRMILLGFTARLFRFVSTVTILQQTIRGLFAALFKIHELHGDPRAAEPARIKRAATVAKGDRRGTRPSMRPRSGLSVHPSRARSCRAPANSRDLRSA
jgi:hypothetical protein